MKEGLLSECRELVIMEAWWWLGEVLGIATKV